MYVNTYYIYIHKNMGFTGDVSGLNGFLTHGCFARPGAGM